MKKLLAAVLVLALIFSVAACAAPATTESAAPSESASEEASAAPSESVSAEASEEADKSWDTIKEKGSFVLGFDETFAPMGFKDENGKHVGFDLELAAEVASRLELELVLQPIDWDSKELELQNGNIDMIWNGLTITDERKEKMLFSDPYMNNRQIVIVAADSGMKTIADLAGKSVAAQVKSSAMDAIEAQPKVKETFGELIESPDYVEALMELKQGSVDAVVIDEIMGRYYIAQDDDASFYGILSDDFGEEQYGIAFRLADQSFRDKVQETLTAIINDGKGAEISKKWFGEDILIKG